MKPKDESQSDSKIIGSEKATLQLSDSQCQDLVKWAKAALDTKVNDIKVS